jgi:hypothetical protein
MMRTLDIRLSESAAKALTDLQRAYGCGKAGDVLRIVVALGVRPSSNSFVRTEASKRMRATVDDRFARDIAAVSSADGVSIERYLDALLREGARHMRGEQACRQIFQKDSAVRKAAKPTATSGRKPSTSTATETNTAPRRRGDGGDSEVFSGGLSPAKC